MSCIHFVGGEKGGVGKSVMSRLLAQYFIDREIPFSAFDSDQTHPALLRYYADYAKPVLIHDFESVDQLVEEAMNEDRQILVDLAAQTETSLFKWLDAGNVLTLAENSGLEIRFWFVIDDSYDSLNLLTATLDRFQSTPLVFVIVKNYGRAEKFSALHWSGLTVRLSLQGFATLELPALDTVSMRKIDRYGLSFWAAIHNNDRQQAQCLNILARERVKRWTQGVFEKIDDLVNWPDTTGQIKLDALK